MYPSNREQNFAQTTQSRQTLVTRVTTTEERVYTTRSIFSTNSSRLDDVNRIRKFSTASSNSYQTPFNTGSYSRATGSSTSASPMVQRQRSNSFSQETYKKNLNWKTASEFNSQPYTSRNQRTTNSTPYISQPIGAHYRSDAKPFQNYPKISVNISPPKPSPLPKLRPPLTQLPKKDESKTEAAPIGDPGSSRTNEVKNKKGNNTPVKGQSRSATPNPVEVHTYPMKPWIKNCVHIFNQEYFERDLKLSAREGTKKDVSRLKSCFENLNYKVEVHNNYRKWKILLTLEKLATRKDTKNLLVVIFLTHGNKNGELSAKDGTFKVDDIWMKFRASNCLALSGKPKLFIFQACKGEFLSQARPVKSSLQTDSRPVNREYCDYTIPDESDVLLAYSTVEGRSSTRSPTEGSAYIQALCEEITKHALKEDVASILTRVSNSVAQRDFAIKDDEGTKQQPSYHTTLRMKCFLVCQKDNATDDDNTYKSDKVAVPKDKKAMTLDKKKSGKSKSDTNKGCVIS